jgi:DNA-binding Xre family transcriptional regulator
LKETSRIDLNLLAQVSKNAAGSMENMLKICKAFACKIEKAGR